jgi:carboxyl-terminal processing protease
VSDRQNWVSRLSLVVVIVLVGQSSVSCSNDSNNSPGLSPSALAVPATVAGSSVSSVPDGTAAALRWGNEMLDQVRAHAFYAGRLDFQALTVELNRNASGLGPSSVYGVALDALIGLKDRHSRFLTKQDVAQLSNRLQTAAPSSIPNVSDLGNGVELIDLPAIQAIQAIPQSARENAYVAPVRNALTQIGACGWVLDLRGNGGGSVPTMLEAVAPLLGPGTFLSDQDRDGGRQPFSIDAALHVVAGTSGDLTEQPGQASPAARPVAVLVDRITSSAAEAVVIAFEGRPSTRVFGQPTHGVPTGNTSFPLSDGTELVLTTAIGVDRNGRTYDGPIEPDVVTPVRNSAQDATVDTARRWLQQQPPCNQK